MHRDDQPRHGGKLKMIAPLSDSPRPYEPRCFDCGDACSTCGQEIDRLSAENSRHLRWVQDVLLNAGVFLSPTADYYTVSGKLLRMIAESYEADTGSSYEALASTRQCPACGGQPMMGVNHDDGSPIECDECRGTGVVPTESADET